jgi:hypothetical protein
MRLARFQTKKEYDTVREMCKQHNQLFTDYPHVGGMRSKIDNLLSRDDWWFDSQEKVNYTMEWASGAPNAYYQQCLCLHKGYNYLFEDIQCGYYYGDQSFICESSDSPDKQTGCEDLRDRVAILESRLLFK